MIKYLSKCSVVLDTEERVMRGSKYLGMLITLQLIKKLEMYIMDTYTTTKRKESVLKRLDVISFIMNQ